ncbi:MAG TPA: RNA 2',3'-cyclic phosphodiesterase [Planctomycetota bacterium]|nr:RNA 2',3'-cyclic phosphodiesterase [Planctomycetota bacterium]
MRAFLAAETSENVRERYADLHSRCSGRWNGLRWVRPRHLHLTLRFFADAEESRIDPFRRRLEETLAGAPPFGVVLGPPGCFGGSRAPRVIYFGIGDGGVDLERVASRIEETARACGFPAEKRPYSAHLTVARNAGGASLEGWEDVLRASGCPGLRIPVEEVVFMFSLLSPDGPVHTPLWKARLKGPLGGPS